MPLVLVVDGAAAGPSLPASAVHMVSPLDDKSGYHRGGRAGRLAGESVIECLGDVEDVRPVPAYSAVSVLPSCHEDRPRAQCWRRCP
jgi:hypothetical protein